MDCPYVNNSTRSWSSLHKSHPVWNVLNWQKPVPMPTDLLDLIILHHFQFKTMETILEPKKLNLCYLYRKSKIWWNKPKGRQFLRGHWTTWHGMTHKQKLCDKKCRKPGFPRVQREVVNQAGFLISSHAFTWKNELYSSAGLTRIMHYETQRRLCGGYISAQWRLYWQLTSVLFPNSFLSSGN